MSGRKIVTYPSINVRHLSQRYIRKKNLAFLSYSARQIKDDGALSLRDLFYPPFLDIVVR